MFEALRARLAALPRIPAAAGAVAAERILARLQADATSRVGTVPAGISVVDGSGSVRVTGPDWVMRRARAKGQPEAWAAIVAEAVREAS